MTKKSLIFSILFFCATLIFTGISLTFLISDKNSKHNDELVFFTTSEHGADLDKVIITTPQDSITIFRHNNYWKVKEGNDYYANFPLLNQLFMTLNSLRYFTLVSSNPHDISKHNLETPHKKKNKNKGTMIQTFAQNKQLDQLIIGNITPDKTYRFVREDNSSEIWLVNNDLILPQQKYSWLQQPLVNYDEKQIQKITETSFLKESNSSEVITYTRNNKNKPFKDNKGHLRSLKIMLEQFSYMTFQEALPLDRFKKANYSLSKKLHIVLFNGLVTDITMHTNTQQNDYWAQIKISATRLPMLGVNDYIKDNRFFYEGWIFRLNPETGYILYNTLSSPKKDEKNITKGNKESNSEQ